MFLFRTTQLAQRDTPVTMNHPIFSNVVLSVVTAVLLRHALPIGKRLVPQVVATGILQVVAYAACHDTIHPGKPAFAYAILYMMLFMAYTYRKDMAHRKEERDSRIVANLTAGVGKLHPPGTCNFNPANLSRPRPPTAPKSDHDDTSDVSDEELKPRNTSRRPVLSTPHIDELLHRERSKADDGFTTKPQMYTQAESDMMSVVPPTPGLEY
jgi:hypothetical protein